MNTNSYLCYKYDFRHLHLSEPGSAESQQQDVAMDTGSVPARIPYNLCWRRKKIDKKIVGELGTDSSQLCKHHYIIYQCIICGLSEHTSAYNCVADCIYPVCLLLYL